MRGADRAARELGGVGLREAHQVAARVKETRLDLGDGVSCRQVGAVVFDIVNGGVRDG